MKQIYNKIIAKPYLSIIALQFAFIFFTFHQYIASPFKYMFINAYDGLKNYFTFSEYIKQAPSEKGLFHFTGMNYPFGEYVFFTDNTPLFAVPLKVINTYIIDISAYTIPIHNFIFLFLWLITPLFIYPVFKRIFSDKIGLAILFSIASFWLNPQLLRINAGHFNLTLSIVLALVIRYLFFIYDNRNKQSKMIYFKCFAYPFLLLFFSGLAHLYYIPLSAMPIGVFVFVFFTLESVKAKKIKLTKGLLSLLGTFLSGMAVYGIIQFIDQYSTLRKTVAGGYGWNEWLFTPEATIHAYDLNFLNPLFFLNKQMPSLYYESYGYWGAFIIFIIDILAVLFIYFLVKDRRLIKRNVKRFFLSSFLVALLAVVVINYAAASGDYVSFTLIPFSFDNILSPFYFLSGKVDMITQFRCLARFSWIGFWLVFIFGAFVLNLILNKLEHKTIKQIILVISLVLLYTDAFSYMWYYKKYKNWNVFEQSLVEEKFNELSNIHFTKYQAILTIPAVHVGSENYDYTIDDIKEWTEHWMQLVSYSGLPTFNCKMSRTAESQAKAQVDLLKYGKVPDLILNQVNDKAVLVVYSPETEQNFDLHLTDYAKEAATNGSKIIQAFNMDTLMKVNNIYYLEWDIKNEH